MKPVRCLIFARLCVLIVGNPFGHALQIDADCEACGLEHKCRSFGGVGTELEDIIDAVIEWAAEGEAFDAVMARRRIILSDHDDDSST